MLRMLIVLMALWPTLMLGGYTKEHIQKSCENYKEVVVKRMIEEFREESPQKNPQELMLLREYHTGAARMMLEFGCFGLINQLEEDYK